MTTTRASHAHALGPDAPSIQAPPRLRADLLWLSATALLFLLYHRVYLDRMFRIATESLGADWSHALVIPLISAYFIHQRRSELATITPRVYPPGLALLLAGLLSFGFWVYPGRNDMLQGYSMIVALLGLALFLRGPESMRILAFPILYLALGVKVADRLWEQLAWSLQLLAAQCAAATLSLLGVQASVAGSTILLSFSKAGLWVTEKLNVAEACSGLRSLMAFVALAAAMAYLVKRPWWHRLAIALLALPVALAVNVARVTVLGLLYLLDPRLVEGDFHKFVGLLMLLPAAGLFWLIGYVLDHLFIDVPDDRSPLQSASPTDATTPDASAAAVSIASSPQHESAPTLAQRCLALLRGFALTALLALAYGSTLAWLQPRLLSDALSRTTLMVLMFLMILMTLAVARELMLLLNRRSLVSHRPALACATAAGVLLAAVLSQNVLLAATQAVLIKESLPLRQPLFSLPTTLAPWQQQGEDERLTDNIIEQLGTRQFLSRTYRDTSSQPSQPGSTARLHLAYYTGTPDTVPHVPERCYVAAGAAPLYKGVVTLSVDSTPTSTSSKTAPASTSHTTEIPATLFTYSTTSSADSASTVVYFFVANGRYLATPDQVRLQGFDPRDRYSYYCKVEIGLPGVADSQLACSRAVALLNTALPSIIACLPDWTVVTTAGAPAEPAMTPREP